jgi:hypothetical protein
VPEHFFLEASRRGVVIYAANLRTNDAFQGLKHRTRPKAIHGVRPRRPFAQVHGIVVSIGKPEANRQPPGCLEAQRIDQLFAKESHRRRTQNDDTLIVKPDNSLIRTEIEQFREVQVVVIRRGVATRLRLHDTPILLVARSATPPRLRSEIG